MSKNAGDGLWKYFGLELEEVVGDDDGDEAYVDDDDSSLHELTSIESTLSSILGFFATAVAAFVPFSDDIFESLRSIYRQNSGYVSR
mgnify:CR=1 FL=1